MNIPILKISDEEFANASTAGAHEAPQSTGVAQTPEVSQPLPPQPKSKKHIHLSQLGHDPYLDWAVICACTFAILVIMFVISGWTYYRSSTKLSESAEVVSTSGQNVFDSARLDRTIRRLDAEGIERQALIGGHVIVTDPSL